jgi:hypothetical protein
LLEGSIDEGLAAGAVVAEQERIRDPWEDRLADIPSHLIHRTEDGRDLIASQDILKHLLEVPVLGSTGRRLARHLKGFGWQRNKTGLVKIAGKGRKGFWRFTPEARS